jgi:serine/threonine protein kinase
MGTVYLALDTQLDRRVALKTPQFDQDSDLLQRFEREARAAAALRHPNICPIYDFGKIDGTHYISMAYIDGESLATLVATEQPQPVKRVLGIARKIALALQEAHDHGIVHRDLKPSNVMLDKHGEPIVMDFGLARQTTGQDNVRLTQSGILVGTPAFMSPEQIEGELDKIGPATDQYSLGVLLYELFTKQLPFRGSSMAIIAQALVKEPPPPIRFRTDLDPRINAACLKMLAKAPEDRFPSLATLANELESILENRGAVPVADPATPRPASPESAERAAARARRHSLAEQFLAKRSLTENEIDDIEKSARRCFDCRDYQKVVDAIGQVPEDQQPARLKGLLADARTRTAEIAALVTAMDDAMERSNRPAALQSATALLKIQPGNPRASEIRRRISGERSFVDALMAKPWLVWTVVIAGLTLLAASIVMIVIGR